ncbi:MAG: ABC transporter permease, partial [Verrucomicrobiae bacterium]|nr:ABC transporter permease [Verrucomicrobiae bacterium]
GCLDRPSSGVFRFAGRDVGQMSPDELARLRREAFGFVFQGYHLIPTESALENVEVPAIYSGIPALERRESARYLLGQLGLGDRLNHRPHQLSGGQQQRVSIARALINGGRVILADEPTGALDSHSGAEVLRWLESLAGSGHSVILITHDREVAARARRIIEIRDGQILTDHLQQHALRPARPEDGAPIQHLLPGLRPRDSRLAGILEALRAAWRVMAVHRFRTALTLLGIIMGVASVIVMLALSLGARERVLARIGAMGSTAMYIYHEVPPEGGPIGMVTLADVEEIRRLPRVRRVMPGMGEPVTLRYGNTSLRTYTQGSTEILPDMNRWPVEHGRYFTDAEGRSLAPVAVIGKKVRDRFFPDGKDPLGETLLIDTAPFEIIGVMSEKGSQSGEDDQDERVLVPIATASARLWPTMQDPEYAMVEADDSENIQELERAITTLLLARHGRHDFSISNPAAQIQAEKEARNTMMAMLGFTAAISLLVGGIGVMNVMLMSVKERTREIGIRIATGARQRDIQTQFLMESALVSLIGGAAGVALALLAGGILILSGIPILFSIRSILAAFLCSAAVGVIFGFFPARRAARLDPVQALASA